MLSGIVDGVFAASLGVASLQILEPVDVYEGLASSGFSSYGTSPESPDGRRVPYSVSERRETQTPNRSVKPAESGCFLVVRREWAEKVERDLLPVDYHHVVLTLPRPLTQLVMAHGDVLYSKLVQAGGQSMLTRWATGCWAPSLARSACCAPRV